MNNAGEANSNDTFKAKCQRDIKHYLRLIKYSLIVGGTGPLDEWGIAGQREVYRALSLPTAPYVEALSFARNRGCTPRDLSAQALTEYNALFNFEKEHTCKVILESDKTLEIPQFKIETK